MLKLKESCKTEEELHVEGMCLCNFLYTNYTDIYNKIRKDEIDLEVLFHFLNVLKEIEEGGLDQHEASYKIGKLLKEMYVDSALRKADKLNETTQQVTNETLECEQISWKQYKILRCDRCHNTDDALKTCSGCGTVKYCSTTCQTNAWLKHKATCKMIRKKRETNEADTMSLGRNS